MRALWRPSRPVALAVAAAAMFVASLIILRSQEPPYVGTTERVTLNWRCTNGISWRHGSTTWLALGKPPRPIGKLNLETAA